MIHKITHTHTHTHTRTHTHSHKMYKYNIGSHVRISYVVLYKLCIAIINLIIILKGKV